MGCGSSKQQGLEENRPAYPVTNTAAPQSNVAIQQQQSAVQQASGGKKRKLGTNLGLLSTLVN